jgi:hypothetical protein
MVSALLTMLVSNCTCVQGEDASVVTTAAMVENQIVDCRFLC